VRPPAPQDEIAALCLNCRHEGTLSAETLGGYGLAADVSLAYLSRFVVCQECGSHAVKLERRAPTRVARSTGVTLTAR
jgi:hypothetical protein